MREGESARETEIERHRDTQGVVKNRAYLLPIFTISSNAFRFLQNVEATPKMGLLSAVLSTFSTQFLDHVFENRLYSKQRFLMPPNLEKLGFQKWSVLNFAKPGSNTMTPIFIVHFLANRLCFGQIGSILGNVLAPFYSNWIRKRASFWRPCMHLS